MGDPRKLRNKYESPRKVWDAERIKRDKGLTAVYGLKNTREIWVALRELKKARSGAMKYLSLGEASAEKGKPLMDRLMKLGIIPPEAKPGTLCAPRNGARAGTRCLGTTASPPSRNAGWISPPPNPGTRKPFCIPEPV